MTKETMTVHKALAELKILDDRIDKAIHEVNFTATKKASATKVNNIDPTEWADRVRGAYDKASDLIRRRNALKKAVVLSNAVTKVTVNGVEYTVAEAIEMKNHGIELDENLMTKLASDYNRSMTELKLHNENELEQRAERFIDSMFSNKEKADVTEVNRVREDFIKANTFELVDPLGVVEIIQSEEEYVSKFKAEVDSALSVSNAITTIEIKY